PIDAVRMDVLWVHGVAWSFHCGADCWGAQHLAARRDRLHLFPKPELGIVFAAFALAYDDGTFGLSFVGLDARVVHTIGLDRQGQVDLWRGQRLEIRRAIGPGEGVQRAATPRYLFADLARAEAFAAFEEHVFDPVRGT